MKINKRRSGPIERYMTELEREAKVLPADRRAELLGDVRSHIAIARADESVDAGPDEQVQRILDQLGAPGEIVEAALAEASSSAPSSPRARAGLPALELSAVVFLLVAGLLSYVGSPLVAIIAWLVGVGLALSSRRWTGLDKVLGVLVPALCVVAVFANGLHLFALTPTLLIIAPVALLVILARLVLRVRNL